MYFKIEKKYYKYIKWVLQRLANKKILVVIKKYKFYIIKIKFYKFIIKLKRLSINLGKVKTVFS